ncbi:hypothetical protein CRX72_25570 [Pantoea sp. BRM17]|nr:hypothetical protein CRX72_25570 [Pantoea sp. BRM17]
MHEAGLRSSYLEGEMVQANRNEAIKRINDGRVNVLVATDVAARGIDIDDVTHVINFEGEHIKDFAERLLNDPVAIEADPSKSERKRIQQWYYRADNLEHKTKLLVHLLKQPEVKRAIVFVRKHQDIVVATTGRLLQYIKEENFDCRAVETLILDEADRMVDMGFAQDIETIAGETRWRKQTLLFSATLLPALQHLLDFPRKKSGPPRILILTPTRELAMQVADQARELAKHTHLDIATITGGVAYMNHAEVFSEGPKLR